MTYRVFAGGIFPLLLASPAHAADDHTNAWVVTTPERYEFVYDGGHGIGSQLDVTLSQTSGEFVFTLHDVVPITAGTGCAHPDEGDLTTIACTVPKDAPSPSVATPPVANLYLANASDHVTYTNQTRVQNFLTIDLGDGNDTYVSGRPEAPEAVVQGSGANDDIRLGTGGVARGGDGDDTITAIGGAATVYGGNHNDVINGGAGDDVLHGEAGDDTIFGNSGDDYISGGPGTDTISGGAGTNTIVDV